MKKSHIKILLLIGLLLLFSIATLFRFHEVKNTLPIIGQKEPVEQNKTIPNAIPNKPVTISNRIDSALNSPTNTVDAPLVSTNAMAPIQLKLVSIPPGTFTIGSPENEQDRRANEGPQTLVNISHGFWLGKYDVTVAQYQSIVGVLPDLFRVPYEGNSDNSPIVDVSWELATNFCCILTEQERQAGRLPQGYVYRLPTEAEWEYACRAGTTTRFNFGDDPKYALLRSNAWYNANSDRSIHTVGTKIPNQWGLYDMHGNVFEWCLDGFDKYPGGSVNDPVGIGKYHITRGGAWDADGRACRSAYRSILTSGPRIINVGFRVALAIDLTNNQ